MTTPEPAGVADDEIRDFTLPMKPKRFKIDADVFQSPAILSPIALRRIAELHKSLGDISAMSTDTPEGVDRMIDAVADIFSIFLPGNDGARFVKRLRSTGASDDVPAVDLTRQAIPALYWLLEEYGLRPTLQSSPLLSDSVTGDSTDGHLATASTGEPSATPLNS